MYRSPGIYLTAEENPGKPQLGDCVTSNRFKWGLFPPNKVSRIAQHVRKGEGRKEEKDELGISLCKGEYNYQS